MDTQVKKQHFSIINDSFLSFRYFVDINNKMNKKSPIITNETIYFNQKIKMNDVIEEIKKYYELSLIYGNYYLISDNNAMIWLFSDRDNENELVLSKFYINYNKLFDFDEFTSHLEIFIKQKEIGFPKIKLISKGEHGYDTITKNLKNKINIDLKNSYNTSFELEKVKDVLYSDNSGLILLSGNPGTGKSYLIKWFTQELKDKKFFYISNENFHLLSDPGFLNFCLEEMEGSVLVLEDCENLLRSRDVSKNSSVSVILNLTDGIIGDVLNLKIIATLNTIDKIDTALLRKGRMLCNVEFKPLTIEQANATAKILGKNIDIINDTCLCDIYNAEQNGVISQQRMKIGF